MCSVDVVARPTAVRRHLGRKSARYNNSVDVVARTIAVRRHLGRKSARYNNSDMFNCNLIMRQLMNNARHH